MSEAQAVIDAFFAEIDARIDGARGTPADLRAALASVRPALAARAERESRMRSSSASTPRANPSGSRL